MQSDVLTNSRLQVNSSGSIYSDITTLALGLVPDKARQTVWDAIAAHGLEDIGDYESYLYLQALASYSGDDGTAASTLFWAISPDFSALTTSQADRVLYLVPMLIAC